MKIIIDNFISEITKILVLTLILSCLGVFFIYSNINDREVKLEEYNEKKLVKIVIKPKQSKYPLIFEEALNVIFDTRYLNTEHIDLSYTLPPLKFDQYDFAANLFLNFDDEVFFETFDEKLETNTSDFYIEDHLQSENSVHMFFTILNYKKNLEDEILGKVKIYIEKNYKKLVLQTLDDLVDFKINYFNIINKQRLEKLNNQNKIFDDSNNNSSNLYLLLSDNQNLQFLTDITKKYIDQKIKEGFHYKVYIKDFNLGRKAFETNISSFIIIAISVLISFLLSAVFFISRKILKNDG